MKSLSEMEKAANELGGKIDYNNDAPEFAFNLWTQSHLAQDARFDDAQCKSNAAEFAARFGGHVRNIHVGVGGARVVHLGVGAFAETPGSLDDDTDRVHYPGEAG